MDGGVPFCQPARVRVEIPVKFKFLLGNDYRYAVIRGGRGKGATWSIARTLLTLAATTCVRILCCREIQNSIADSVHRVLSDQIQAMGFPQGTFRVLETTIICPLTGSMFLFEGIRHNVTRIKGMEGIDIVWGEETENWSNASWEVLIPTIRKPGSRFIINFNPRFETDPTYVRFIKKTPPRTIVQEVSWRDNPFFPRELEEERAYLERTDFEAYLNVWEGQCVVKSSAQVLRNKWRVGTLDEFAAMEKLPDIYPHYGADWGFAQDPTTLLRTKLVGAKLYVTKELYRSHLELNDIAPAFREFMGAEKGFLIRADSARPETISHVANAGLNITGAEKPAGSVEEGVVWLRGLEEIIIHPDCHNTAVEAARWSYKVDKLSGDVLPVLAAGNDHCWDAVRYALAPLILTAGKNDGMLRWMAQQAADLEAQKNGGSNNG